MLGLILVAALVVVASALSSMSEAAMLSISEVDVEKLLEENRRDSASLSLKKLHSNLTHTISVLVILNNIANIAGTLIVGGLAAKELGTVQQGIFSAVLTFVIIVWSEIIPKTIGERHSGKVCLLISRPLALISYLLGWLAHVLNFIAKFFVPSQIIGHTTDEAEILLLAKIGGDEGAIDKDESEMIARVFNLDDTTAGDIMTPRVKMCYFSIATRLFEIEDDLIASSYSRIILVGEGPDDIKGVAFKNELLSALVKNRGKELLENFCHKVRFVPEQAPADKLLRDFQSYRQHLAVVMDEYSGVAGIVTLEDVLEVLTGEIVDEYDSVVDLQLTARLENERDSLTENSPKE